MVRAAITIGAVLLGMGSAVAGMVTLDTTVLPEAQGWDFNENGWVETEIWSTDWPGILCRRVAVSEEDRYLHQVLLERLLRLRDLLGGRIQGLRA